MDFPFIFKMSVKGHGSGVDILKRMQSGEDLHGTWVMFDVMRRITIGWLTFSAHVYDHNYRALCTIFTCELMAEDSPSLEIAWRQMVDVAREYGLLQVHIHGFMADNAIGGWIAVRNVFFGGVRDLDKEISDAFHWAQSLLCHLAKVSRSPVDRNIWICGKNSEMQGMLLRLTKFRKKSHLGGRQVNVFQKNSSSSRDGWLGGSSDGHNGETTFD